MKKISIDVMVLNGARYYCTLSFVWDTRKPLTEEWVHDFVVSKRPSLKYKPFTVMFN